MWNRKKIQAKWSYFRAQRLQPTGNFTEFVVRVYYAVLACCMEGDGRSCPIRQVRNRRLSCFVYRGIYDRPDHDYDMVLEDCKRNLLQMGYLHLSEDGMRIFVDRPLDFLLEGEHERYLSMARETFCLPSAQAPKKSPGVPVDLICPECGGKMVLRRGTYGVFFGCSHFPRCRCTMPLAEGTFRLLQPNGMALYAVSRPCWKCGQPLRVRSYFPYFDLLQWLPGAEELLQPLEAIRLSIFPQLDAYLERHCDNIAERYSKKAGFSYVANLCPRCDMLQGSQMTLNEVCAALHTAAQTGTLSQYVEEYIPLTADIFSPEEWRDAVEYLMDI